MKTTLARVREVIKTSNMSQTKIASILGVTPQYIWKILNTECEPSERILLAIESNFSDINKEWLRNGVGVMKMPITREAEVAKLANDYLTNATEEFKREIINVLTKLEPAELYAWYKASKKIVEEIEKPRN